MTEKPSNSTRLAPASSLQSCAALSCDSALVRACVFTRRVFFSRKFVLCGVAYKVSEAAQDLMRRLMDPDTLKRHTMKEAEEHPWVSGADKMEAGAVHMSAFELMQHNTTMMEEEVFNTH